MSGNILTPMAIWQDFSITEEVTAKIESTTELNGYVTEKLYIDGRKTEDGKVSVFGIFKRPLKVNGKVPAILLIQDFSNSLESELLDDLASKGYAVLAVDLAGKTENKEFFTEYPESISYANYENVKSDLYTVLGDVNETCWYEWACVLRYSLKYLSSQTIISKIGGFGIGEAATVLWQVAGVDKTLSATVFALNAGWRGYRGVLKFGGMLEPQFSDNMYKFIAGVEPQSYAMNITCPTLVLSATNSNEFDCDRAFDTVSRISEAYSAICYSVGLRNSVCSNGYCTALSFLETYLVKSGRKKELPEEPDLKCEIEEQKLAVLVTAKSNGLKALNLFVAEETVNPEYRCWKRIENKIDLSDNEYKFFYQPYFKSGRVFMFVQATYSNGMTIGSKIIMKKFGEDEVKANYRENVLYSSRYQGADSVLSCSSNGDEVIAITDENELITKKGPMGILGAYCKQGILTFKISAQKDKPIGESLLMLDVYSKQDAVLSVALIADYFGQKVKYFTKMDVLGGDVWHNVKIERLKLKTVDGMPLKSYDKIDAMEINVEGSEYLINNVLWV